MERTVIRTQHKKQTSQSYQDTVVCNVIDNEGRLVGKRGITTSAIEQRIGIFPLQTQRLTKSLCLSHYEQRIASRNKRYRNTNS